MITQSALNTLVVCVNNDPTLTSSEKSLVLMKLHEPSFLEKNKEGIVGAGLGLAISKFLKLSRKSQILLTLAGFGIGKYILAEARNRDKFVTYNDRLKVYEIH